MDDLGDVIRSAVQELGLKPASFKKPLKSLAALVRFKKRIEITNIVDNHAAVGWGMVALCDAFGKELFSVKSLTVKNENGVVDIEGIVVVTLTTFESDHEAYFDEYLSGFCGKDIKQGGYYWKPQYWHWDSCERLEPIRGFIQLKGDGIPSGPLEPSP